MVSIGVDQLLNKIDFYAHICMENINKLLKNRGKCDYQHQYKEIIESDMVSTPEGCTNNSTITLNPAMFTKSPIARKPLRQFSETLDVKHKTDVCKLGAAKVKHKSIKIGNVLW